MYNSRKAAASIICHRFMVFRCKVVLFLLLPHRLQISCNLLRSMFLWYRNQLTDLHWNSFSRFLRWYLHSRLHEIFLSQGKADAFIIFLTQEMTPEFVSSINPLQPGVAFLYPLKTSENLKVCWCFQGYVKVTPGCNGLIEYKQIQ